MTNLDSGAKEAKGERDMGRRQTGGTESAGKPQAVQQAE